MALNYVVLIFFVFMWGGEFSLYKALTAKYPEVTVGFWTFLIGTTLMAVDLAVRPSRASVGSRSAWLWLLAIGGIGLLCNLTGLYGIKRTSATNAAALSRSDMLFTLFISVLIAKEKIQRVDAPWILAAIAGVLILMRFNPLAYHYGGVGDVLILGCAALISINAFLIKALSKKVRNVTIAFANLLFNTAAMGALMLCLDAKPFAFAADEARLFWMMIGMGVLTYVWFLAYYHCLEHLPIWQVRLVALLVPAVTALLEVFCVGLMLQLHQIVGMLLLMAGAAGIVYRHFRTPPAGCARS